MRRALAASTLIFAVVRSVFACSSFEDAAATSDPDAATGADADLASDGNPTADAIVPDVAVDAGSDATVYRFGDGGHGDFAQMGNGTAEWLSENGAPYVRLTGEVTFEHVVPIQVTRATLAFRVRVLSGPDGGLPYISVAMFLVSANLPDAGSFFYQPRVLQQQTSILIGSEDPTDGGFVYDQRTATPATFTKYLLRYEIGAGKISLLNEAFADAVLPFALVTNPTSITVRAGALGPDHVVDVADLSLTLE